MNRKNLVLPAVVGLLAPVLAIGLRPAQRRKSTPAAVAVEQVEHVEAAQAQRTGHDRNAGSNGRLPGGHFVLACPSVATALFQLEVNFDFGDILLAFGPELPP